MTIIKHTTLLNSPGIDIAIGEVILFTQKGKSKQSHKVVKDTEYRYACDYCSLRDLDCSIIKCGSDERSDGQNIHFINDKSVSKPL